MLRNSIVLIGKKREFLQKLKGDAINLNEFKLDLRGFAVANRFRNIAWRMIKISGYPVQAKEMITCNLLYERCYAECKILQKKQLTDMFHFLIDKDNRNGKCWITNNGEFVRDVKVPKDIIEVIKKYTRHQPKRVF
jgi:hypothetical protein